MKASSFCTSAISKVFCQTAIESAQNDQTTMVQTMLDSKEAILSKLKSLFYEIDADEVNAEGRAGELTVGVFEAKMKDPEVHNFFESLGLDIWDVCLDGNQRRSEFINSMTWIDSMSTNLL